MKDLNRQRIATPYMWGVACMGAATLAFSLFRLNLGVIDLRFVLLTAITVGIGSRITISIPRFKSEISISDTFILLTMLLYGGEPAILLATVEAALSSARFSKRRVTYFFNSAVMALSTF